MDKKQLTEQDIRTKYITPAIVRAGWDIHTQVYEEFSVTDGRIVVRGRMHSRNQPRRADYVLCYQKAKPMRFDEFATEIDWWGNETDGFASRVENEHAWKVSIDDIKARNYNLDIKNPHVGEQISHDPNELLDQYANQQNDIQQLRDQLKGILAAALTGEKGGETAE